LSTQETAEQDKGKMTGDPVTYQIPTSAGDVQMETFIPWTLVKRGVRRQVITPLDKPEMFEAEAVSERRERLGAQAGALVRCLGLAHYWQQLLDEGRSQSMTEIAAAEEMDLGQFSKIARLAQLAPDIVDGCIAEDGSGLALEHVMRGKFAIDWTEQRRAIHTSSGSAVRCGRSRPSAFAARLSPITP
jgi:hypothetical protein